MLLEVAAFTLFILLVGRLGEDAMAATTRAFNVNSVAFIPMLGLRRPTVLACRHSEWRF
ncbi:MAG: hypothetical protein KJZ87_26035 [Thermoguttaceae bacterium]|nr:hypothetical protein [Thermoguttaceae bacterium]